MEIYFLSALHEPNVQRIQTFHTGLINRLIRWKETVSKSYYVRKYHREFCLILLGLYTDLYVCCCIVLLYCFCWSPEFFRRYLWFQSHSHPFVCLSVCNAFSLSLMSQIFWYLVYSLSGVKVREYLSLLFLQNSVLRGKKTAIFGFLFPVFAVFWVNI